MRTRGNRNPWLHDLFRKRLFRERLESAQVGPDRGGREMEGIFSFLNSSSFLIPRKSQGLPGTQGPSRSLSPTLLGSSGLSLRINSLNLGGGGRRRYCAVCKTRDNKPSLEITSVSKSRRDSGAQRGSSVPELGLPTAQGRLSLPAYPLLQNHMPAYLLPEVPSHPPGQIPFQSELLACLLL